MRPAEVGSAGLSYESASASSYSRVNRCVLCSLDTINLGADMIAVLHRAYVIQDIHDHHVYQLIPALWKCRGPLRLPTPGSSLSNGSAPAPLQSPADAIPAEAAGSTAGTGDTAVAESNGKSGPADDAQKAATPDSIVAELVALLSHKDNKASGRPLYTKTCDACAHPDLHPKNADVFEMPCCHASV